jgi:hypothetical protein
MNILGSIKTCGKNNILAKHIDYLKKKAKAQKV